MHTLTQLEVRDALLGDGRDGLLTGDRGDVLDDGIERLGVILLAVRDLVRNAGRLAALRADDHDLAGIDRGFGLDDAALILLVFRLLVLRGDVHALHDDLAALRVSRQDFAFLALVAAGQNDDFIVFTNLHSHALLK